MSACHDPYFLFCAEYTVAGIAETGNNVRMIVEVFVKSGNEDVNIGMLLLHSLNALGRTDERHKADVAAAVLLEQGQRVAGGTAGRQHGIDQDSGVHVGAGAVIGSPDADESKITVIGAGMEIPENGTVAAGEMVSLK